ncbi:hypothetical protein LOD99_2862 [Oopsacas minuta]|uniref:Uncharacterized protein n=1 Tax=Oopsacas minuta TaxID=111878 RepID=A0AAV7JYZ1_9METZ|nr:hypothetical protein LOD99_2862 [Oopsacas minuta]
MAENIDDNEINVNPDNPPVQTLQEIIKKMHDDYQGTQKSVKSCILVLTDETIGLLSKDLITKVGDKMNGNTSRTNPMKLRKKLEEINTLLNRTLLYIEWLMLNIEKLERVETMIQEYAKEYLLDTNRTEIQPLEKIIRNSCKTITITGITSMVGTGLGGTGGCGAVIGTAIGVKVSLISITNILSGIGIGGIAGCAAGIIGGGAVIGLAIGATIALSIWFIRAYNIGKSRKVKFKEIEEMERDLNQQRVKYKLSLVGDKLNRIIIQVKEMTNPNYRIEDTNSKNETQRRSAVEEYHKVYKDTLGDPITKDLPDKKKIEIAKYAAKKACRIMLKDDLIYSENEELLEKFIRERINIQDEMQVPQIETRRNEEREEENR